MQGNNFLREKVRVRDNHTCQKCGKKWKHGERRFDVHHLDAKKESSRLYSDDKKNLHQMMTYCHKCHMTLPHLIENIHNKYIDRNKKIIKMRNSGMTLCEISKIFNLTHQRISQICE